PGLPHPGAGHVALGRGDAEPAAPEVEGIPGADAVNGQDVQQVAVLPGAVAVGDQVAGGGYAQDEGPQHQEGPVEPAAVEGDEGAGRLADVAPVRPQGLDR